MFTKMFPVFKTLKTHNSYYVYDRNNNSIITISEQEYNSLKNVENGIMDDSVNNLIQKYQAKGFLKNNQITAIEHPCTNYVQCLLENNIEQITLQVTQRCNLRCSYCVYSGKFDNRVHSNLDMSFEQAKQAIIFGLQRSNNSPIFSIGFYGGEPLLMFDLIQKCVSFVEENAPNRKIDYTITTNGTLLTLDKAEYLFSKNFHITISLDGSKEEHNLNRVFQNGIGSFDTIMKNLAQIKKDFPEKFNSITYNCVVNPNHNFEHIKLYFDQHSITGRSNVMYQIVDLPTEDTPDLADSYYQIQAFEYLKMLLFILNKLPKEQVAPFMWTQTEQIMNTYDLLNLHGELTGNYHHSGPCIPGVRRPFVNCFGNIYPCERVSETSEVMKIGTLDNGYDLNSVKNILNVGKITEDKCLNCWALLYCGQCARNADGGTVLSRSEKLKHCHQSQNEAESQLLEMCILKEFGCNFNIRDINYYDEEER